jgi:hypothetical protein
MYFNFLPAIKYDQKPISYPFSESDYVVAKNFFRRYKISDTAFSQSVYFNKYALQDGQRLDQIAEAVYNNPNYDWIIVLTNNMVNTQFDLPMSESELRKHIESQYDNPYYDYHHYEIISDAEQEEKFGKVLMPGGTVVDETFYNNRRVLTLDNFPDLSSTTKTIYYSKKYIFSSDGFDNSFVVDSLNANFVPYGSGQGEDGGFVLYSPFRNGIRSNGYLRFRGAGERYAQFYQLDATYLDRFIFKGKFGNDINGGEEADEPDEILKIQYRTNPTDPWTEIDVIIPLGMVQYIDWNPTPQPDLGFGGPGRPEGLYENVTLYFSSGAPTAAKVNVTVDSDGSVSDIEFVDRGEGIPFNTTDLIIRNEDIGNGFFYLDAEQTIGYLPNLPIFNVSTRQTPSGVQYGRYSNEPYVFVVDVPEEAKTTSTEFRLFQPENSGIIFDQYAIQELEYQYSQTITIESDLKYVQIDTDNYVIDGVRWTRINGGWYRVTEIGYRYNDNGSILEISGSDLSRPVTQFEYEQTENEKKREIYILKPNYVTLLVDDFRKAALYKKSSDYVSNRLKKTGV